MLSSETVKNLSREQREALKQRAEQALLRYAEGNDHSAGYDILRYAKAGMLTVKDEVFK